MSIVNTATTCGFVLADSDWSGPFLDMIIVMEMGRGSTLSFKEKQAEWLKWNRQAGSGTTAYINSKDWIVRVGNAPTLSPGENIDRSVTNGYGFTIPELIGYTIANVKQGTQNLVPETDGYSWDSSTGTFTAMNEIFNSNVTFTSRKVTAIPAPTGSIILSVSADGVDYVTDAELIGKTITAYTHGNTTSNEGFTKLQASDTFTLTDGNLFYTDAPVTLFY